MWRHDQSFQHRPKHACGICHCILPRHKLHTVCRGAACFCRSHYIDFALWLESEAAMRDLYFVWLHVVRHIMRMRSLRTAARLARKQRELRDMLRLQPLCFRIRSRVSLEFFKTWSCKVSKSFVSIDVLSLSGENLSAVVAHRHWKLQQVKQTILAKLSRERISSSSQLVYESQVLEDHKTLADFAIWSHVTLYLVEDDTILVQVLSVAGEVAAVVDARTNDTVRKVKQKIRARLYEPKRSSSYQLVFGTQVLRNRKTLTEYGISCNVVLNLLCSNDESDDTSFESMPGLCSSSDSS